MLIKVHEVVGASTGVMVINTDHITHIEPYSYGGSIVVLSNGRTAMLRATVEEIAAASKGEIVDFGKPDGDPIPRPTAEAVKQLNDLMGLIKDGAEAILDNNLGAAWRGALAAGLGQKVSESADLLIAAIENYTSAK